ncbi:MAG: hypothetical protein AAB332_04225, partial [Planctomycetota bacterium]
LRKSIVGHSGAKIFGIIFGRRLFQQNQKQDLTPFTTVGQALPTKSNLITNQGLTPTPFTIQIKV